MTTLWIDFAAVKERASFEAILRRYGVTLSGTGAKRMVLCPFHEDREPSCSVHLEQKLFNCFACEAQGDIFDFVARIENIPLRDAAVIISEYCNILHMAKPQTKKHDRENPPLDFTLRLNPEHLYLQKRGVSPETVKSFGLGYCNHGIMKGRICIPIHDANGRLVGYAGRWAGDNPPQGEPRYKLPPRFKKTLILYNFHRVAAAKRLVIVEGYWSVFRLHELGMPAVALMGRTLSAAQENLLISSGARLLTLFLDGDNPGREATAQLLPRLSRNFFAHAPALPEGAEPDTMDEGILKNALSV